MTQHTIDAHEEARRDRLNAEGRASWEELMAELDDEEEEARLAREGVEKTQVTVEGRTFEVKTYAYGDGFGWTVKGSGDDFGFSGSRGHATREEAVEDAVERIEAEIA